MKTNRLPGKSYLSALTIGLLWSVASLNALAQNPSQKLAGLFKPSNSRILVAAHRGDWRDAPENSMQALSNSIAKGFDIMELDVRMTKDSTLVVMHDNTIDRTTNGKGKVSDFTLAALSTFRLKNALGRVTQNPIPTLYEMMKAAKGKIIINVDKGNDHLAEVFKVLNATGTMDQAIVNVGENMSYATLLQKEAIPKTAYLMVVVNMANPDHTAVINSYVGNQRSMIQPIFDNDHLADSLPIIAKKHVLWLNSLWPSLNGGHDDDRAVELGEVAQSWGWLIEKKPKVLQTDRPVALQAYLKRKKLN